MFTVQKLNENKLIVKQEKQKRVIDRKSAERIILRRVLMPRGIYMHYFTRKT